MVNNEFRNNWDFQEKLYPQVKKILEENASKLIKIEVGTDLEDKKEATDFKIIERTIALRIRRNTTFRDLTIRSFNHGAKTEIDKIKEGFGDIYLYIWTDKEDNVEDWVLVDIDKLRESNLLENRRQIFTPETNTKFIFIPVEELTNKDCIITRKI